MTELKRIAVVVGAVMLGAAAMLARPHFAPARSAALAPSAREAQLAIPHVMGSITLDGDLDDTGWLGPVARTGPFLDKNGGPARPYSEARLTWGDGVLYLSLYAADEDIHENVEASGSTSQDDEFHFVFDDGKNERIFDVSVGAVVTDGTRTSAVAADGGARPPTDFEWASGTHVSREVDGTVNDASDDDEEWALEVAVPLSAIGLRGETGERVRFAIHRCDSPKQEMRTCASWGERSPTTLVLQ